MTYGYYLNLQQSIDEYNRNIKTCNYAVSALDIGISTNQTIKDMIDDINTYISYLNSNTSIVSYESKKMYREMIHDKIDEINRLYLTTYDGKNVFRKSGTIQSISDSDTINSLNHGLNNGDLIYFEIDASFTNNFGILSNSTGNIIYTVIKLTTDTFRISLQSSDPLTPITTLTNETLNTNCKWYLIKGASDTVNDPDERITANTVYGTTTKENVLFFENIKILDNFDITDTDTTNSFNNGSTDQIIFNENIDTNKKSLEITYSTSDISITSDSGSILLSTDKIKININLHTSQKKKFNYIISHLTSLKKIKEDAIDNLAKRNPDVANMVAKRKAFNALM